MALQASTALLLLASMLASVVQTAIGTGFGIVMMCFLPYILADYSAGVAISGLGGLAVSVAVTARHFKNADFKAIKPLIIGYFLLIIPSVRAVSVIPVDVLTKALGVMLVFTSVYFVFFSGRVRIKPTFLNGFIAGGLAAVGAGLFSIGGPPVTIYLLSFIDDKETFRSSSLTYFTMSGILSTGTRVLNGIITPEVIQLFLISLAAIAAGGYIGGKLFNRIDTALLKKLVYITIGISGLNMLF